MKKKKTMYNDIIDIVESVNNNNNNNKRQTKGVIELKIAGYVFIKKHTQTHRQKQLPRFSECRSFLGFRQNCWSTP